MSKTYQYLATQGNSVVFANATDLKDQVRKSQSSFIPKGLSDAVYKDLFTLTREYFVDNSVQGQPPIKKVVLVKVEIQGTIDTKAVKLAMLDEAKEVILESPKQLDGFPPNALETIELGV